MSQIYCEYSASAVQKSTMFWICIADTIALNMLKTIAVFGYLLQ